MVTCTGCGCSWDENEGFYHYKGVIQQPCAECRKDAKSITYLNNRENILEAQRKSYYEDHESRKAYYREYRRMQRAQATA